MPWEKAAILNHMGEVAFRGIFPGCLVPIIHGFTIGRRYQDLGSANKTRFYFVDIEALQEQAPKTWEALLKRLSEIHGDSPEQLQAHYEAQGLELREELVSEIVYRKYFSAWEAVEALKEILGKPLDDGGYFDWEGLL